MCGGPGMTGRRVRIDRVAAGQSGLRWRSSGFCAPILCRKSQRPTWHDRVCGQFQMGWSPRVPACPLFWIVPRCRCWPGRGRWCWSLGRGAVADEGCHVFVLLSEHYFGHPRDIPRGCCR